MGVETEYLVVFEPAQPGTGSRAGSDPTPREICESIIERLGDRHGRLPSGGRKPGWFLGSGGLVHFESIDPAGREGLFEWASPECAGAAEAAAVGLAQRQELLTVLDELEADLAHRGQPGRVRMLKNNADAYGHGYGSHENYAIDDPPHRGARMLWVLILVSFSITLFLVNLPLRLLVILGALGVLSLRAAAALLRRAAPTRAAGQRLDDGLRALGTRVAWALSHPGQGRFWLWVRRYEIVFVWPVLRIFAWPAQRLLFPRLIEPLASFLASRPIICASGGLAGGFCISPRAEFIGSVRGIYMDVPRRPMIDLKAYLTFDNLDFFRATKRLHLMAGDANVTPYGEWLRLGSTDLVLRLVERGGELPRFAHPVRALHAFSRDPDLQARRSLRGGGAMSALEHQFAVLEAVESMLRAAGERRGDREIVAAWREILEALRERPALVADRVEWVRKRALLDEALALGPSWAELTPWLRPLPPRGRDAGAIPEAVWMLRKLDARFHEISTPRDGYALRLERAGLLCAPPELERAQELRLMAPADTRARRRGAFVRQRAGESQAKASWDRLWVTEQQVVELDDLRGDEP